MSEKSGVFTPNQLKRLPDNGYLVEILNGGSKEYTSTTVVCIMNGCCKYTRLDLMGGDDFLRYGWGTLLWNCVTTKKQIASPGEGMVYHHFKTHEEMLNSGIEIPNAAKNKAPNDK